MPGHAIRRLHQTAVVIFVQEIGPKGLTPVPYAVMQAVANAPGADQCTLDAKIGLDTPTIGGVIDRLETRGLSQRNASADERRVRWSTLTEAGHELLELAIPATLRVPERLLDPLSRRQQAEFVRMLRTLVTTDNELGRTPGEAG